MLFRPQMRGSDRPIREGGARRQRSLYCVRCGVRALAAIRVDSHVENVTIWQCQRHDSTLDDFVTGADICWEVATGTGLSDLEVGSNGIRWYAAASCVFRGA